MSPASSPEVGTPVVKRVVTDPNAPVLEVVGESSFVLKMPVQDKETVENSLVNNIYSNIQACMSSLVHQVVGHFDKKKSIVLRYYLSRDLCTEIG